MVEAQDNFLFKHLYFVIVFSHNEKMDNQDSLEEDEKELFGFFSFTAPANFSLFWTSLRTEGKGFLYLQAKKDFSPSLPDK